MDEHNDADEPARFPFDAIYKALCCQRQTIENILTGYLAEPIGPLPTAWIDSLDFAGLRKLSTEWVTREFRLRRGDQVWEVPFKAQAQAEGYPRFLLLNLEFQSRRDGFMALRFLEYGNELYREVRAQGVVGEGDPCPVLCVLLHNGRSPWTAPTSAAATLSMPAALGRAVVPPSLVAFHPWGYFPLDFVAQRDRPHIPGDIISMMVGIEFATKRADLVAPLWDTVRQLADDELRATVARWLRRMDAHYNLNLPGLGGIVGDGRCDRTDFETGRDDRGVAPGRVDGGRGPGCRTSPSAVASPGEPAVRRGYCRTRRRALGCRQRLGSARIGG